MAARGITTHRRYNANTMALLDWFKDLDKEERAVNAYADPKMMEKQEAFEGYGSSPEEFQNTVYAAKKREFMDDRFMATKPVTKSSLGVQFKVEKLADGEIYPVTPRDVQKELLRMPKTDRERLTAVEFVRPKGQQRDAYAQYVRSKRKVLIFSQPVSGDGKIDGHHPEELRSWMKTYVVPHEFGHHRALTVHGKTDRSLAVAEARADASAARMHPMDRDAVKFAKFHRNV